LSALEHVFFFFFFFFFFFCLFFFWGFLFFEHLALNEGFLRFDGSRTCRFPLKSVNGLNGKIGGNGGPRVLFGCLLCASPLKQSRPRREEGRSRAKDCLVFLFFFFFFFFFFSNFPDWKWSSYDRIDDSRHPLGGLRSITSLWLCCDPHGRSVILPIIIQTQNTNTFFQDFPFTTHF